MKIKNKYIHILIIVIGTIFILLSMFHQNIWFDESYSVAIAKHSFFDIWNITGNDVHPPLYYWMLHILWLIFGNNIMVFRGFSVLAVVILGILGFTHIRKDFGEKTGILFSFLTFFLPAMCTYSQEIRMYSWACLFVTITAIYAYRIYKSSNNNKENKENNTNESDDKGSSNKTCIKNLVIFGIFSIFSCYTHYYSLLAVGIINLLLLIYLIKQRKENKKLLNKFLIVAAIQILLYIPWLIYLINQLMHVGGGFWITLGLNTLIEVPSFQFRRQLISSVGFNVDTILPLVIAILMYIYIGYRIYKAKKEKQDIKPAIFSIIIYALVILIVLIASLKSPILLSRYLLTITGLYIFVFAFFMTKEKKNIVTIIICAIIFILALVDNIQNMKINYDESNMKQIEYLKENVRPDDIFIYRDIINGGVISAFFPENKQYFYNEANWDVEEAYKAYAPGMETITNYQEVLNNYEGRIWLVDSGDSSFYNSFNKEGITTLEGPTIFNTKYQNYTFNFYLLEK